jgi:hypothetical protein
MNLTWKHDCDASALVRTRSLVGTAFIYVEFVTLISFGIFVLYTFKE